MGAGDRDVVAIGNCDVCWFWCRRGGIDWDAEIVGVFVEVIDSNGTDAGGSALVETTADGNDVVILTDVAPSVSLDTLLTDDPTPPS